MPREVDLLTPGSCDGRFLSALGDHDEQAVMPTIFVGRKKACKMAAYQKLLEPTSWTTPPVERGNFQADQA
ncbi:MAG TPA: hypothetical protein VN666_00670 [Nitrospira sp.]|nr:hypothetical protein [Nitrospira sp.]